MGKEDRIDLDVATPAEMEAYVLSRGWTKIVAYKGHDGLWQDPLDEKSWLALDVAAEIQDERDTPPSEE